MDCVFCKIVKGEIDSAKVWEDEKFIAILDVNPNTKGMTLLLTKKHYDSYVFDMTHGQYSEFVLAARKAAKILERGLKVARVSMVVEGMGINHAHIKLYPLHKVDKKFKEMWAKERIYFDKYEGYLSTQLGPQAGMNELKKLAEEIQKIKTQE